MELLIEAGADARRDEGSPTVRDFGGHFRRIPDYGICLDARNSDIHFLKRETRLFRPGKQPLVVPASTKKEREIVVPRLRRLIGRGARPVSDSTSIALETPLGARCRLWLPTWVEPPRNLLLLGNGSISIRRNAARIGLVAADRATVRGVVIEGDFNSDGRHWVVLKRALEEAIEPREPAPAEPARSPTVPLPRPRAWRPKRLGPLPPPRPQAAPPRQSRATPALPEPTTRSQGYRRACRRNWSHSVSPRARRSVSTATSPTRTPSNFERAWCRLRSAPSKAAHPC